MFIEDIAHSGVWPEREYFITCLFEGGLLCAEN
jgi:hypothetical protein